MEGDIDDDVESTAAASESTALSIFSDEEEPETPSRRMDGQFHLTEMPIAFSWTLSTRAFCTREHQIVSPIFEISEQISCRIILKSKAPYYTGPASFLKSSGCGSIEFELVKNEGGAHVCGVAISIGKDAKQQSLQWPGKVNHDFEHNPLCCVGEKWDFLSAANSDHYTLLFSIEVFVRMLAHD
jgi:hypothetical protein